MAVGKLFQTAAADDGVRPFNCQLHRPRIQADQRCQLTSAAAGTQSSSFKNEHDQFEQAAS